MTERISLVDESSYTQGTKLRLGEDIYQVYSDTVWSSRSMAAPQASPKMHLASHL